MTDRAYTVHDDEAFEPKATYFGACVSLGETRAMDQNLHLLGSVSGSSLKSPEHGQVRRSSVG